MDRATSSSRKLPLKGYDMISIELLQLLCMLALLLVLVRLVRAIEAHREALSLNTRALQRRTRLLQQEE